MKNKLTQLLLNIPDREVEIDGVKVGKRLHTAESVAEYLIEQGVLVPPCKVGDTAYHLTGVDTRRELDITDLFEGKVCSISKQEESIWIFCRYNNGLTYWYTESDIGKKLFLTREEAEKHLRGANDEQ